MDYDLRADATSQLEALDKQIAQITIDVAHLELHRTRDVVRGVVEAGAAAQQTGFPVWVEVMLPAGCRSICASGRDLPIRWAR